jgi:F-type H+-transporting ATPase subunit delta
MIITITAKRYARALFEIAQEKKIAAEIVKEFKVFITLLETMPQLQLVLGHPNEAQRDKIFSKIFQNQLSPIFFNFLRLVLKNKRYLILTQIFDNFQYQYETSCKRRLVEITTAFPLEEAELEAIRQQISHLVAANVLIENKVAPEILGGMILCMDDRVLNASFLEHFKNMKFHLIKNQKINYGN